MTQEELNKILDAHKKWLNGEGGGVRANLRWADLQEANLRRANLRNTNLRRAKLDFDVIQCSGIGSERRMTTYIPKDNLILCGCFNGTLEEFEAKIKDTHKDNPKHLGNYLAMVEMFKSQKEFCK